MSKEFSKTEIKTIPIRLTKYQYDYIKMRSQVNNTSICHEIRQLVNHEIMLAVGAE